MVVWTFLLYPNPDVNSTIFRKYISVWVGPFQFYRYNSYNSSHLKKSEEELVIWWKETIVQSIIRMTMLWVMSQYMLCTRCPNIYTSCPTICTYCPNICTYCPIICTACPNICTTYPKKCTYCSNICNTTHKLEKLH